MDLTVRTALVVLCSAASVWLFLQLWQILLVLLVALTFVGMLNPFVERLEARRIRRPYATALVFGGLFVVAGGAGAATLPGLVRQVTDLVTHFPEAQARLASQLAASKLTAPIAGWVGGLQLASVTERAKEFGLLYAPRAIEIIAYGASALFLALYLVLDRDRMRGAVFSLVPRNYHVRLSRVLMNLEVIVGGYMRGQLITSALMAIFTFVVLTVAGVEHAAALALFAGAADVLPYIGALLACGPAFLAALSRGPTVAIVVLVLLAAYQELESRVIVPRIYGQVLRLPPAAVMLALLIGGKLLGILGALLALPIAAGIRMFIEEMRIALPGEEVDDTALRAKDAEAEAEFEVRSAGVSALDAATIAAEIAEDRRAEDEELIGGPDRKEEAALVPMTSGKPRDPGDE